jgi:hypothetical protein
MWKLIVGFALFAALAIFMLMKGGANVDLGGEKNEMSSTPEPVAASAPAEPAPVAASAAASAASQ